MITLIARGASLAALTLALAFTLPTTPVSAASGVGAAVETQARGDRRPARTENRRGGGDARMQRSAPSARSTQPRSTQARSAPSRSTGQRAAPASSGFGSNVVTRAQNAQQAQQADPRGNARTNSSDRRNNVRTAQVGQRSRDGAAFRSDQRGNVRATQDNRRGDVRNNRVDNRNAVRRDSSRSNYRGDRNSYGNDRRDYRRWDRGWRSNRNYNWADYRRGNHFIYRPGAYYAPYRSHRYSRFHTGFYLNSVFFQQRFYINDPYAYRLPPAYAPYQWVRYYDDVVLVDIYTGEVVDVIHDFFW